MKIKVGILSDTHISSVDTDFLDKVEQAFTECDVIIHAGDLTDISILAAFKGKEVHAVCGNCCNYQARSLLPEKKSIIVGKYSIGICHGAGNRLNIEDRMFDLFCDLDCAVFGHTHIPVCKTVGKTLLINPGSFTGTGTYGAQGTYAILTLTDERMDAAIHHLK